MRVSDLQGLLLRHRPDIVHFSGHGSPASSLILEDAAGKPHEVPAEALAGLLGVLNDTVRCVVLNACYSQAQAAAIARHVDAIIGMADAMGDQASTSFAAAFYQALGYGKDVPTAFRLGVSQIKLFGLEDSAVPQRYIKQPGASYDHWHPANRCSRQDDVSAAPADALVLIDANGSRVQFAVSVMNGESSDPQDFLDGDHQNDRPDIGGYAAQGSVLANGRAVGQAEMRITSSTMTLLLVGASGRVVLRTWTR